MVQIRTFRLNRLLVGLFLFLVLMLPVQGADFQYWWPWIYRHCITNSAGTNAWSWIIAHSGTVHYVESNSNHWDLAITNGYASASNDWNLVKDGYRLRMDYSTNADHWLSLYTNDVQYMVTRTSDWNTVAWYVEAYSNWWDTTAAYAQAHTSEWDHAYSEVTAYSNTWFEGTNLFAGADTTGQVTSAAGDAGKYLKADGTWDTPSASFAPSCLFHAYKSSGQSCAAGASILTWENEQFDVGGDFDLSNEWLDVPSDGKYLIGACATILQLDDGEYFSLRFLVNSSTVAYLGLANASAANQDLRINGSVILDLNSGDHVTVSASHNHGGALFVSGSAYDTFFWGQSIGF